MLYSSSFVGTLIKNEIPEDAMELCQLKIKQLSPDIVKFRKKHENNQDNPFILTCFVVSRSFLFLFHAGPRGLGSNNFRTAFPDYLSVSYDYGETELRNSFFLSNFSGYSMIYANVGCIRNPLKQDLVLEFCRKQNKHTSILTETHINHDKYTR